MKKAILILAGLSLALPSIAGDIAPFKIYKENGRKTSARKMFRALSKSDLVLFGEIHNSPVCHWLQYEASVRLIPDNPALILAAEMFESDNQEALNAYLEDTTGEAALDSTVRLWSNYKTDYAPLVELAKVHGREFLASNVPRTYAAMVYRQGFEALDTLPESEKKWIAPLPIPYDPELPGYLAMLEMGQGHGGDNLPKAQALKDATMGHFISRALNKGKDVLHFNGTYHSDNFEGILYYVLLRHPDVAFTTISSVMQADVSSLNDENKGKANYIICIDKDMTPTY